MVVKKLCKKAFYGEGKPVLPNNGLPSCIACTAPNGFNYYVFVYVSIHD